MEFSPGDPDEMFNLICSNFDSSKAIRAFSKKLVIGVWEKKEYLDGIIRQSSKNWRLERMSIVDRSIIRLGVFELVFIDDIPSKVSIDEAVELGKRYGSDESKAFINGVLDNVLEKIQTDQIEDYEAGY
jgi:transcription antitermination factor NusB